MDRLRRGIVCGAATTLYVLTGLLASSLALAAPLSVSGTQYPAWLERAGHKVAIAPGDTLQSGDVLVTGNGGKAWLIMEDGALVKFGENARLRVNALHVTERPRAATRPEPRGHSTTGKQDPEPVQARMIEGSFDVLEGAFRYTTQKLLGLSWGRAMDIGLGGVATAGIRGTDLWGRVDPSEQFVVLLEGAISMKNINAPVVEMSTPLQRYSASTGQIDSLDMPAVEALAVETELDFGQGVQVRDGAFVVHLAAFEQRAEADRQQTRLSEHGLATRVLQTRVKGNSSYRVSVENVKTLQGAQALAGRVTREFGFDAPWIGER